MNKIYNIGNGNFNNNSSIDFSTNKEKQINNKSIDRNNLIDCLTQLKNYLEDEIRGIIKEREKITG